MRSILFLVNCVALGFRTSLRNVSVLHISSTQVCGSVATSSQLLRSLCILILVLLLIVRKLTQRTFGQQGIAPNFEGDLKAININIFLHLLSLFLTSQGKNR